MRKILERRGITLIALVITIIVLLILAGITINLTIGQNGIMNMAEKAGKNYLDAEENEQEELAKLNNELDRDSNSSREEQEEDSEERESEDIYSAISLINESGIYDIKMKEGNEYTVNAIVYNGNLNLNGTEYNDICTYSNNVYTFGSSSDVAYINNETNTIEEAKNMLILKVKGNLDVSENITVTPYKGEYGGPKGFFIYVEGNLTNNGIISNRVGCYAAGEDIYLWKNKQNYEMILADGVLGGEGTYAKAGAGARSYAVGKSGTNAKDFQIINNKCSNTIRALGAGGGGGVATNNGSATSSAGADSNSFTAGAGGGAYAVLSANNSTDVLKAKYCKATDGYVKGNQSAWYASGGAGCPKGTSYIYPGNEDGSSEEYCGGLIVIYTNSFYNNSTGVITTQGGKSGANTKQLIYSRPGGGSSGGGSINIFYKNEVNLEGEINVKGGISFGSYSGCYGGTGGEGTYNIGSIATGEYVSTQCNY